MKKIVLFGVAMLLLFLGINTAFAQNLIAPQNNNQLQNIERNRLQAQNLDQVEEMNQTRARELEQERIQLEEKQQEFTQNQDRTKLGAYTISTMLDLIKADKNAEEALNQIENSVQNTLRAEEKIRARSKIKTFFVGGDQRSAKDIEQQVNANTLRLQQLNQIKNECECDQSLKSYLNEQIQLMDQEQERLQELAQTEKEKKSLWQRIKDIF